MSSIGFREPVDVGERQYLGGVAFCNGSMWAEEVARWFRARRLAPPAAWPGRAWKARARMAITAKGRAPELHAWLAERCMEAARERWAALVAKWKPLIEPPPLRPVLPPRRGR